MSDLFGNHIVGFPTRRLIHLACFTIIGSYDSNPGNIRDTVIRGIVQRIEEWLQFIVVVVRYL